jgi:hypothetical protein
MMLTLVFYSRVVEMGTGGEWGVGKEGKEEEEEEN